MTFEEIYFEHYKMVFNLALQYVQNIQDAEEITQDVFVKVFDNLNSFKNQSSLKTWIYRISINQALDFIKAKNSQKRSFLSSIFSLNDENFKFVGAWEYKGDDINNEVLHKEALNYEFIKIAARNYK